MKIALNQWMFPATMSTADCFRQAKEAGADGVEVNISYDKGELNLQQPLSFYEDLAAFARELGMEVPSVLPAGAWGNIAAIAPGSEEAAELCRRLDKLCDVTRTLNTDTILLVAGGLGEGAVRYDTAWNNATANVRAMAQVAAAKGVYLAVENVWSKFLLTPLEMCQFIDQFASEYVKAYLDVGNMLLYGFPEQWIPILGERIRKVHLKDFRRAVGNGHGFVGLLEGDVNWPAVMQALRDVGYDGFLTAELSRPAHHWQTFLRCTCLIMRELAC
jgi:L-ribulose-5-phosphate 3-epimerase